MLGQYILDDQGTPTPEPNFFRWAMWMATYERVVAKDFIGDVEVSTIFLGLDCAAGILHDEPLLWETMIFPIEDNDHYQRRYASREEALEGHAAAVKKVKAKWN